MLDDAAVAVEHHDAVVHVLDHELIDASLGGEAAAALASERLVRRHALREPARHADGGEAADGEQARLQEVGRRRIVRQHPVTLLEQQRDRGERGVQPGEAPRRHDGRAGQRDHEHHAQAAADAPARVHEHRDRHDVERHVQRELQVEAVAEVPQHPLEHHGKREVTEAGIAEKIQRVRAHAQAVAVDQADAEEQRRQNRDKNNPTCVREGDKDA